MPNSTTSAAALRGQLSAVLARLERHRETMLRLRGGLPAQRAPLSRREVSRLTRQSEDLRTAIAFAEGEELS